MRKILLCVALASAWLGFLGGCSTAVDTRRNPELETCRHFFVQQPFNENHHIDELLAAELRRTGHDASSGPLTMMPDNTDALVTYSARWTGDFTTSLLELDVEIRRAHAQKTLAQGRYYQPSVRPKSPEVVIRDLIAKMFAK